MREYVQGCACKRVREHGRSQEIEISVSPYYTIIVNSHIMIHNDYPWIDRGCFSPSNLLVFLSSQFGSLIGELHAILTYAKLYRYIHMRLGRYRGTGLIGSIQLHCFLSLWWCCLGSSSRQYIYFMGKSPLWIYSRSNYGKGFFQKTIKVFIIYESIKSSIPFFFTFLFKSRI